MKLDEIAKLAGVSRTTASYVINGKSAKYRISERTQLKVMAVVNEHNYRPDHAASALRAGTSRSFGLIIPDLENTSYAKIAKLLERDARQAGYQLIISCSDDNPTTEMQVANTLLNRKIDALIVATSLPADNHFYPAIQASGTPVIAIDRALNDEDFACVISEDLEGAFALTEKLLDGEIKSVGLIGAVPELGISRERERGFISAANKAGVATQVINGEHFSQEEGKRLMLCWYENNLLPDAVVTTSYALFEGVLDAILVHPEIATRTRFATFGDNRMLDFIPMKVHSLPQQFELISEHALELTLNAVAGRYQQGVEVVPRKPKWRC
ncbi:catabolite repressor/activator [Enterovibrio sp. ZSDZ42]|uniref:Catabolite repressor/activator n=1 Tax=Enterovibrio gelatinilyticus TaxID=2899819 RepID=A0ABT5QUL2_9GAMM|nr:catabolite repressor/activator [Enterovibrio sp. ZSDZ42]MDD1791688.1 catabolite repressor/activator [Enterovibrio sp. ZSDZ42]